MGFSQEEGYTPVSIETMMAVVMANVNEQFRTSYTTETFVGTNHYKYFYALMQRVQEGEVKLSEIFLKLQQYFAITNEMISRPVVTNPGIIDKLAAEGYIASVKPPEEADAGKMFICVDVDDGAEDYAETKLDICTIIKDSSVAGVVTMGDESQTIVLTNGQSFDFKFNLPDPVPVLLRLTVTLSENNQFVIAAPEVTKQKLLDNLAARYRLGKNFEPQKYFQVSDAPWASQVLLEYSTDDGMNWETEVYDAEFDELFTFGLDDVELVEE